MQKASTDHHEAFIKKEISIQLVYEGASKVIKKFIVGLLEKNLFSLLNAGYFRRKRALISNRSLESLKYLFKNLLRHKMQFDLGFA